MSQEAFFLCDTGSQIERFRCIMKKRTVRMICAMSLFLLITLVSCPAFATGYQAVIPTFDVFVNQDVFYSYPPTVVVEGRTYLPLRALGEALGVSVSWNTEKRQVLVSVSEAPAEEAVMTSGDGYELFPDVPDFGFIFDAPVLTENADSTVLGKLYSYVYIMVPEQAAQAMEEYSQALSALGYKPLYNEQYEEETLSLFLSSEGRLVSFSTENGMCVVSVAYEKHSVEEWRELDVAMTGQSLLAVTANFEVLVDGEPFVSEIPVLVVQDRTYLPLRAMGEVLGVPVAWNPALQRVEIGTVTVVEAGAEVSSKDIMTVYAQDGRTQQIFDSAKEIYTEAGWYSEPVVLMYAADGRTMYVPESQVEAQKTVGWYSEPVVRMYTAGGRSIYVPESEIADYFDAGWYIPAPSQHSGGRMVYVEDGKRQYHFDATCSANADAHALPVSVAQAQGFMHCPVCVK